MAFNVTNPTDGWTSSTSAGTSANFGTYTPTANALHLVWTMVEDTGGSPEQPTLSGTGGWNQTYTHVGGLTFGNRRVDIYSFTAGGSPSSGSITISTSGTHEGWQLQVVSVTPTAGETPAVVSGSFNSGSTSGVTSYSLSTGTPAGVTIGFVTVNEGSVTALSGLTNGLIANGNVNGYVWRSCWDTGSTDPVGFSWNTNAAPGLLVLEVDDAAGGGGGNLPLLQAIGEA